MTVGFDSTPQRPGKDVVLYLVAKGGEPTVSKDRGDTSAIALMSLLGNTLPKTVTINELTTVASAFTAARFINGESISGNPLGLRIAAGNAPNLVDPATGGWGKVLLDPLNSTHDHNAGELGHARLAHHARMLRWPTTIGAPASSRPPLRLAERRRRTPSKRWPASPASRGPTRRSSTHCLTKPIRSRRTDARRSAPFVPYLAYVPDDFALSLCFAGGGVYANGRFMFDAEGNLWSGMNWMPGSQSGVNKSIGGGVVQVHSQRNRALPADHRLHRHGH